MNSVKIKGDGPIAIVDDQAPVLKLAKIVFEKSLLKNPVIAFNGGQPFLEYMHATKSGHERLPEVILLDLNMPHMNGFEVLQSLREDACFKESPPIVVFTASSDPNDRLRAMELGANAFQTKFMELNRFIDFANSLRSDYSPPGTD